MSTRSHVHIASIYCPECTSVCKPLIQCTVGKLRKGINPTCKLNLKGVYLKYVCIFYIRCIITFHITFQGKILHEIIKRKQNKVKLTTKRCGLEKKTTTQTNEQQQQQKTLLCYLSKKR